MATLKRLSADAWKQVYNQLEITPSPFNAQHSGTGQHAVLISLLNRLGYNPRSREDAIDLAEELIALGYEYDLESADID